MSKGKVIKHIAKAKYLVECHKDMAAVKARIETLTKQIEKSNQLINNDLQTAVNDAQAELNAIVFVPGDTDAFKKANLAWHKLDNALMALANEKIVRKNALQEKGKLEEIKGVVVKECWLADYNTELPPNTEVGLIDFYEMRETQTANRQVIIPAYINPKPQCLYLPIRDARLIPSGILTTYLWCYHFLSTAGIERHYPRYRKGVITALYDNGLCDVTVDDNYTQMIPATAKPLTNKERYLKNVKVRYLTCNADAFTVGDRVILEYPLKDIHHVLFLQFDAQKQALEKRKQDVEAELAAVTLKINAQKTEIDLKQQEIDALLASINDDKDSQGVALLQQEIDTLNQTIADLTLQIVDSNKDKVDYENEYNSLQNDIVNLNAQLVTLESELQALIDNNASQTEIDNKQLQINQTYAAINGKSIDSHTALSNRNHTQFLIDSLTSDKLDAMSQVSDKRLQLQPLLNLNKYNDQQLKLSLHKQVELNLHLKTLENEQFNIRLNNVDIDAQIIRLTELANQEQGKSQKLTAYTATRPKEITVIGFESNPRQCYQFYVTYTDHGNTAITNTGNRALPHSYGKFNRRVYKKFNEFETRVNYFAGGHYSTNYRTDNAFESRYWANSKGNIAISWDTDSVYFAGKGFTVVAYTDAHPHSAEHDFVCFAALNEDVISQSDYDYYQLLLPDLPTSVIGCKRFVIIKNEYNFKLELWALLPATDANLLNLVKCYERDLTEITDLVSNGFNFADSYLHGFMGDALSLIIDFKEWDNTTNGNSANDGLFKCVFNSRYSTQTLIKIAEDVYPVITHSDSFSSVETPSGSEIYVEDGLVEESLVSGGLDIQQIFIHQDSLTVIMRTKEIHVWNESFHRDENYNLTLNGNHQKVSAFKPYKLVNNQLVDTGIVLFRHKEIITYAANDTSTTDTYNQISSSPYYDVDAVCLYANAASDLYVYQTFVENWDYAFFGSGINFTLSVNWHWDIKTIVRNKGVETVISHYTTEDIYTDPNATINNQVAKVWTNYANLTRTYAEEWSYLRIDNCSASYDNKTCIVCFNDHWSTTIRPHTIIFDAKQPTKYTLLDYRVDRLENFIFPLSVTI